MVYDRVDSEKLMWIFKQRIFKVRGIKDRIKELEDEKKEVFKDMEEIIKDRGHELHDDYLEWYKNNVEKEV